MQFFGHVVVVLPINKAVARPLVARDAHFGVHVVLQLKVVAVEVVGRDVEQHGDIGAEVEHIVQLERRQFYDIAGVRVFCHLQGKAAPDVPGKPHIGACLLHNVENPRSGGGLAVAAGDANHLRVGIARGKFYFRDNGNALFAHRLYHRCVFGNARTFHDFIGVEHEAFGVPAVFKGNVVLREEGAVFFANRSCVRHKNVIAFFLCEYGCAHAALACSKCYKSHNESFFYLIFNVIMVNAASRIVVIQKRMVILDSCHAPCGHLPNM